MTKRHDILLRLGNLIHIESAFVAPQTTPVIEGMRDAMEEIKRLRAALDYISDNIRDHQGEEAVAIARAALKGESYD